MYIHIYFVLLCMETWMTLYENLDDFGCTAVDLNSFICKWPLFAKSKFTFANFSRAHVFLSRGCGVMVTGR